MHHPLKRALLALALSSCALPALAQMPQTYSDANGVPHGVVPTYSVGGLGGNSSGGAIYGADTVGAAPSHAPVYEGGLDPSGNLQGLQLDANKNLLTHDASTAQIVANTAHPGSGAMVAVSTTAVTNGFALPVGVIGTRVYLPTSSESVTYTVEPAASCGVSSPAATVVANGPTVVDENLSGQVICVIAASGAPRARAY